MRIELVCDLCTPFYLLRIVQYPSERIAGAAYLLLSHLPVGQSADTSQERINGEYAASAAELRAGLQCDRPSVSSDSYYESCRLQREIDWRIVLDDVERSGLLSLASETGYAPEPWAWAAARTDSTTGRVLPRGAGCNDMAGTGIVLEILEGERYRAAYFWCLEAPGPIGGEHQRAAAFLHRLGDLYAPAP